SAAVRDTLEADTANYPEQWYPPYLLATWLRVNGDRAGYDRYMQETFARTGAAIVQRLVDEQGDPAAGYRLPPVAVGFDRVIKGKRNATLALVYPAPFADSRGVVYL